MVSKTKSKKTEAEEERVKPKKNRRRAEVKKENADQKENVSGIEERAGEKNEEMITMMNEDKRKEAQKRLTEEERVRRLREGGETMRAELTMEESERIAQLGTRGAGYSVSEEEQERRRITGTSEAYRGYGETQKAEMAMWGKQAEGGSEGPSRRQMTQDEMRKTGSDQVNYPSGGGSYYTETFEKPIGSTGPESSFGRTERTPSGRQYAEGGGEKEVPSRRMMTPEEMRRAGSDEVAYRAGSGTYYSETFEKPTGSAGPESSFGRTERTPSGRQYAEGEQMVSRRNLTQEEMRRTGSDQTNYPAGGGSYYSETFEKPTSTTGPESSFGRTERMPSGRQYAEGGAGRPALREEEAVSRRNLTQEEMRRTGSDQVNYPAGGGSYYTETFERPIGSAGPEGSFGRTERIPSGQQYAEKEVMEGRMGVRPAPEPGPTSKAGQTAAAATVMMKEKGGQATGMVKEKGGQAMEKGKEYGTVVVSKTRGVTSTVTEKAKEYTEGGKAEDTAHRAGVAIGSALRKAASVVRELGSGLNKGLNPKEKEPPQSGAQPERGTEEMVPRTEAVKAQEARKKQNE